MHIDASPKTPHANGTKKSKAPGKSKKIVRVIVENLRSISSSLSTIFGDAMDILTKDDCHDDKSSKEKVASSNKSLFFWTKCHFIRITFIITAND